MCEDDVVTDTLGARERNKRATREALDTAAKKLFAERGYTDTTVRDIADAAGVTERTFFRYFAGKEELILDDVLAWLPLLQQAIVARPAGEAPLVAVLRATTALLRAQPANPNGQSPLLLFANGRPVSRIGSAGTAFMLRVEDGLAQAVRERLGAGAELEADLAARVALAVFRSVLIEATRNGRNPDERRGEVAERLDEVLEQVRAVAG
jgi:AcrR family transcriptional regulator